MSTVERRKMFLNGHVTRLIDGDWVSKTSVCSCGWMSEDPMGEGTDAEHKSYMQKHVNEELFKHGWGLNPLINYEKSFLGPKLTWAAVIDNGSLQFLDNQSIGIRQGAAKMTTERLSLAQMLRIKSGIDKMIEFHSEQLRDWKQHFAREMYNREYWNLSDDERAEVDRVAENEMKNQW